MNKDFLIRKRNELSYNSHHSTLKLKQIAFNTFLSLGLDADLYILYQKYIELLEQSFPFYINKRNQLSKIDSLLDDNLKLFDGISIFDGKIKENIISNETEEFYFGKRKSIKPKRFFIGKLLEVKDLETGKSIIDNVLQYDFQNIKINYKDAKVRVTHLRAFPHYEMGVFMYLNQAKRKINGT